MLDIKNGNNSIVITITEPTPEELEIYKRAKACKEGFPFQRKKQSKDEIKTMFSKFRCNQSREEETQDKAKTETSSAAPTFEFPDIPEKYFAPVDECPDDDYPF